LSHGLLPALTELALRSSTNATTTTFLRRDVQALLFASKAAIVVLRQRVEVLVEAVKLFHRLSNAVAALLHSCCGLQRHWPQSVKVGLFSRKAFTIKL
jgi:hypothetical protein